MSIIELGALGEFVGSILVLGTLIYLVVQVQQTKRGIDASNLASVVKAGADSICVASAVTKAADISAATSELVELFGAANSQ